MSLDKSLEMIEEKVAAQPANGPQSPAAATLEENAPSAAMTFRREFYATTRPAVLQRLGEEPNEYLALMESMLGDMQPTEGVEKEIVLQMIESVWRMRRARRMQEGLAIKRIQVRLQGEGLVASTCAWNAMENVEPFKRLQEALSRRGCVPSSEEIEAFVKSQKADASEATVEFIRLLKSLSEPLEAGERKARLRKARAQLRGLMQGPETAAWRLIGQADMVESPENLAALMAPQDPSSLLLQKMDDSNLQRFWRLSNTLMKIRQGGLAPKNKNSVRSRNVDENKGTADNMS